MEMLQVRCSGSVSLSDSTTYSSNGNVWSMLSILLIASGIVSIGRQNLLAQCLLCRIDTTGLESKDSTLRIRQVIE